ncbi:OLC1v1009878C1 [Oldenlandia corymbosa var. corymbosa]|uniref:OLC1v1009878C1 n=1 Tax=Oldenlandia corymbosa var. corymbosa TaxID=529605 RepID=A0AAV1DSD9_OLDCO|nr:OLC1v1009878C1 [Oldenlandia corymbosa var. corymbosa]
MALKFLNKKGWHTGSLRNIENVWKAEQKHEAEQKKLEELRKQIQEERERSEFRLLQEQAGLVPRQERLEFLYDSGLAVGKGSSSGGFKALESLPPKPTDTPASTSASKQQQQSVPGALFEDKQQSSSDAWRKLHSDPLLLIRQREQEALTRVKNNPIQMAMIRKSVEATKNKKNSNDEDVEKASRKKRHKRKHEKHSSSKHHSDSENSDPKEGRKKYSSLKHNSDSEDSDPKEGRKKYSSSKHHSDSEDSASRERRKSTSRRGSYKASRSSKDELNSGEGRQSTSAKYKDVQKEDAYRESRRESDSSKCDSKEKRFPNDSKFDSSSEISRRRGYEPLNNGRHRKPVKLSEEERAARLREMQMDAEIHEKHRLKRIKKAEENDNQEAFRAGTSKGRSFLDDVQKSVYGTDKGGSSTIEESVRRRTHYLQGRSDASEVNAFRR